MTNLKFKTNVIDYITSTTKFTKDDVIEVNVSTNGDWIKITINGGTITFFYNGEVNANLNGKFSIETINALKDVMESGEEIWYMLNFKK